MSFEILDALIALREEYQKQEDNSWDGRDSQIEGYERGKGVDAAIAVVRRNTARLSGQGGHYEY